MDSGVFGRAEMTPQAHHWGHSSRIKNALGNTSTTIPVNHRKTSCNTNVQSKLQHVPARGDASIPTPLHSAPAPTRLIERLANRYNSPGNPRAHPYIFRNVRSILPNVRRPDTPIPSSTPL